MKSDAIEAAVFKAYADIGWRLLRGKDYYINKGVNFFWLFDLVIAGMATLTSRSRTAITLDQCMYWLINVAINKIVAGSRNDNRLASIVYADFPLLPLKDLSQLRAMMPSLVGV